MATKQATKKEICILHIYRWKAPVNRICFEIESTDGSQTYNVCFNGDTEHGSCTCDGHSVWHKTCKHITQLTPKAQEYFESRETEDETPGLDAAEAHIASLKAEAEEQQASEPTQWIKMPNGSQRIASQVNDPCLNSLDAMTAAYGELEAQWQARQQAAAHKMEVAPSGRLVPMR